MRRLFIDGVEADLGKDTISLNWEFLNVLTPDKRYTPFTSSLNLPFTARNKSIMGYGDVPGSNLTKIRDLPNVDLWLDLYKVIESGYLKSLSSDKSGYKATITGKNNIITDLDHTDLWNSIITHTNSWASYTSAINDLKTGSNGWLLPRTLADPITSTTFNIYNLTDGYKHELWLSAAKIADFIETYTGHTFKVYEGGAMVTLSSSALWPVLQKLYTPAWNYVLHNVSPTDFYINHVGSGVRIINGNEIEYSTFNFFGGASPWGFIKTLAHLFCSMIIVEGPTTGGTITFVPVNNIGATDAIDMTGKTKNAVKYHYLQGYEYENYIRYKNTDNLPKDFAQLTVFAPVNPVDSRDLFELSAMLPGLYYSSYTAEIFNTDPAENSELMKTPLLLYDDGHDESTVVTYTTNSHTVDLKILSYFDFSAYYAGLQLMSQVGEMYDVDLSISLYDFLRFKPYRLIRVNELGGLFYLNKITGFDPYSPRPAKAQLIKFPGIVNELDVTELNFIEDGEQLAIEITSNIAWTASASEAWISLNKTSGVGTDTLLVTVGDNSGVARTGYVTINFSGILMYVDILQPYGFVVSVSSQTDCTNEGDSDGSVTIGVTGGTAPYEYKIDAGAYQTSNVFSGLAAGDYTVTVKDDNDVTEVLQITILEPTISSSGNILLGRLANESGGSSIDVYPVNMATTATLVDTGDGTAWVQITQGATAVGDFGLVVESVTENTGAQRSCNLSITDDAGHASPEIITITQEEAP